MTSTISTLERAPTTLFGTICFLGRLGRGIPSTGPVISSNSRVTLRWLLNGVTGSSAQRGSLATIPARKDHMAGQMCSIFRLHTDSNVHVLLGRWRKPPLFVCRALRMASVSKSYETELKL